jgi:hypothetical protein
VAQRVAECAVEGTIKDKASKDMGVAVIVLRAGVVLRQGEVIEKANHREARYSNSRL